MGTDLAILPIRPLGITVVSRPISSSIKGMQAGGKEMMSNTRNVLSAHVQIHDIIDNYISLSDDQNNGVICKLSSGKWADDGKQLCNSMWPKLSDLFLCIFKLTG